MREEEIFKRLEALEAKVSELYRRLGSAEPQVDEFGAAEPDPEVLALIQAGKQIEAIKRYRELTGMGLAESQQAVQDLYRAHGPIDPDGVA